MALGVTDSLLVGTLVGQLIPDLTRTPLLVRFLLDPLDPMVGDSHGHPEIKPDSTGLERSRQASHSADILGNSYSLRLDFLYQHIGES